LLTLGLVAALACAFLPTAATAATCDINYTGPANGVWGTEANWQGSTLPTEAQNVCIPAGKGTIVVASKATAHAKTLATQSGLRIEAEGTLALAGKTETPEGNSTFVNLTVAGDLSSAGSHIIVNGNALVSGEITQVSAASSVVLEGGTLSGTGKIAPPLIINGGQLLPGGASTIGTLSLGTTFVLKPGGTLVIDLASHSSVDRLEAGGDIYLQGTIALNRLGGYTPSVGETWNFSKAGGVQFEGGTTTPGYFKAFSPGGGETFVELTSPIPPEEAKKEETQSTGGGGSPGGSGSPSPVEVATTPAAIEELKLGCTKRPLVLNDVVQRGGRVLLTGSAAKSLVGKKVKIVFNSHQVVAAVTVGADGQFQTTAPLPPARIRNTNSARYVAVQGKQRSLDLKLTRRLILEPPKFSAGTVTLTGQVVLPLTKPVASIAVQQQLKCGKTTIAKTFTPSANGRFRVTIAVPGGAQAAIYRLTTTVAAKPGSKRGFATFSLPLPVLLK
jgi:hypothetical protein